MRTGKWLMVGFLAWLAYQALTTMSKLQRGGGPLSGVNPNDPRIAH